MAPAGCARVNGAVSVTPVPETCAPEACAIFNGATSVIVAGVGGPPARPGAPGLVALTVAVSAFPPLSIVMGWLLPKPATLATVITVAPAAASAPNVVAPGVPISAITANSAAAPEPTSIATVSPTVNAVGPEILM